MVRRGSTVRVRQRALEKPRKRGLLLSLSLARSTACGGYGALCGAFRSTFRIVQAVHGGVTLMRDRWISWSRRSVTRLGDRRCSPAKCAAARGQLRHTVCELRARLDAELPEHFAQVILDRARADEQLSGDLPVGVTLRDETRDLGFLRREVAERVHRAPAGTFPRRLELDACALREGLHPELGEELVCRPQLRSRVDPSAFPSEPLAVVEVRAREVDAEARRPEVLGRLAVKGLGRFSFGEQSPRARF